MKRFFAALLLTWFFGAALANPPATQPIGLLNGGTPPLLWTVTNQGSNANVGGATISYTIANTVPVGALVVVFFFDRTTNAPGSLADSKGNSYALLTSVSPNGSSANGLAGVYWSVISTSLVASTDSITYTKGTTGTLNAGISVVSAVLNSTPAPDVDVTATAVGSSAAPSVVSGIPNFPGELMFEWVGTNGTNTITIDTGNGWSNTGPNSFTESSAFGGGANQVNAGIAAKTAAPTIGTSRNWGIIVVGFQ